MDFWIFLASNEWIMTAIPYLLVSLGFLIYGIIQKRKGEKTYNIKVGIVMLIITAIIILRNFGK